MPIIDKNGQPMPLGYIGDIQLTDQLGFVFSGIWGGCRYSEASRRAESAIFVPTATGDYQVYAFAYSNNPKQYQYLGIYLGRELDTAALARGEYDLTRFALETNAKRVIGETIETSDILAEYMINKYPVGGQFSFYLTENMTENDINYRQSHIEFLRIIQGEPPDNDLNFPHPSGIIIPQQLEDMFNY